MEGARQSVYDVSTARQRDLLTALGLGNDQSAALALSSGATEAELAKLTIWALARKAQVTVQNPVMIQVAGPTDTQVVGDWDITGVVKFGLTTVTATLFQHGISTTGQTIPGSDNFVEKPIALAGFSGAMSDCVPTVRLSLDAPANVFLVARITMSAGTAVAYGNIRATKAT